MNKQKGITLIALIVSIIVMLILVAVTVNIVTEGGLIDKASKARGDTEAAMQNETSAINDAADNISNIFANDASDFEVDEFNPNEITSYVGTSTEVVIPSKINGVTITTIAFSSFAENTNITKVVIPSSVTTIEYTSFRDCTSLEEILIPSSVVIIDPEAFEGTPFLNNLFNEDGIAIYNNIFLDTNDTFKSNSTRTTYTFPENITVIAEASIRNPHLTSIILNNNLTHINEFAFIDCISLTSITIPSSVKKIEYGAFKFCYNLTSITINQPTDSISGAPWLAPNNPTIIWN